MQLFYVYILASKKHGVLYIGSTRDIAKRIYQHKQGIRCEFTKKYHVHRLVYYKSYENVEYAIRRERQMKKWKREWKVRLIEEDNPEWEDLYEYL